MKKKIPVCIVNPSSPSSGQPSLISQDDDWVALGNVNKAKVMELLGVASPQECLEINDLLSRTHSNGDIDKAVAFPLPFHPTNQKSSCTDMLATQVSLRPAYVRPQHNPLVKTAFVQELATSHWAPKLFKFQCLAGISLMLDSANGRAKSSQLRLHSIKGDNSSRQEGTFPLPPPCSQKYYLPSPIKMQGSPVAHPLPPPLSRSSSNSIPNYDKVDMVSRRTVSCSLLNANESSAQEAMALPSPMVKSDMQATSPHMFSLEAPNYQFSVNTTHKSPSIPSSTRQSPRPSPLGSLGSVPNSPLRSPPSKTLCPRKWRKGAVLGQGTFGIVHEGLNLEDGSFFAIKVSCSADVSPEIQQEVDVLSKLEHPNIVRYLGSSIEDGRLCIFIELVRMGSLETILRKYKRFEDNTIRSYTRQILLGLEYLHAKKTMHRDIKCANILVDVNGQVKLSDFGVAKEVDETLASSLKGTPLYMAPEVLTPKKNSYSFSADIWSLGCTVLEMADGKPPWSNLEGFGFLFKVKKGELPPMPDNLSLEGKDFVYRCLKFHAQDRPTASELLQHPFVSSVSTPEPFIPRAPPSPAPTFPSLKNSWECGDSHLSSLSIPCTL